jgi:hypothetical protein
LALAEKVSALVTSSSPGPTPAANAAPWRAAVPEEKVTAKGASQASAIASSNESTAGPCVSQALRSVSITASTSRSSTLWRP